MTLIYTYQYAAIGVIFCTSIFNSSDQVQGYSRSRKGKLEKITLSYISIKDDESTH